MSRNVLADKPYDRSAEEKKHAGWITIAQRVMNGDYNRADGSTIESLTTGLRGYPDDVCKRAMKILRP